MPFEPLQTDERLSEPVRRPPDFDAQMLGGCSSFMGASLIHYGLASWPHFALTSTHLLSTLIWNAALGLLPALVFMAVTTRKFGLAAAAGNVGGALATAIFFYLRLEQIEATRGLHDFPQPEFPSHFVWLLPLGWVVSTALVVVAALPAREWSSSEDLTKNS